MSLEDKKWAKKASELQFGQLDSIRSTASNWRTGLIALTALVGAVTVIKGPEAASDLSASGRALVGIFLIFALLALLIGSGLAMLAAFGIPGPRQLLTTDRLKRYEREETERALGFLTGAVAFFFVAMLLIGAAIGFAWFDGDLWPKDPAALVAVEVADSDSPICGELKESDADKLIVETENIAGTKEEEILYTEIEGVAVVDKCETA